MKINSANLASFGPVDRKNFYPWKLLPLRYQNCWEAPMNQFLIKQQKNFLNFTTASRTLHVDCYVSKRSSSKNSERFFLTGVAGFLQVSWKFWKMSRESSVMQFFIANCKPSNCSLQPYLACFINSGKFLITCAAEFLFTEAGVNRFSTE